MHHNSTGVRVKFEKAHLQAHRHFCRYLGLSLATKMSTPGLVCVVLGAPRAGSTSLVRDLGRVMSDSYVAFPAGDTMVDSAPVGKQTGIWEQRLRAQFRAHMKALRIAAAGTGVILDGSIGQLMAQIEVEHKHARLAPDAARIMIAFGQQLLQRTPQPNVVVHLDTTPAGLVARPSQNESLGLVRARASAPDAARALH